MRRLRADPFARRPRTEASGRRAGVTIFILALVSLALLVLSRIDHPIVRKLQSQGAELTSPVLQVLMVPFRPLRRLGDQISVYSTAAEEVERMRDENVRLKGWEARALELERRLADLSALARVVDEQRIHFVTGRVIADARGPFARSAMLNAGQEHGLANGFPVISSDGLVGRVLETGARSARILLLTDLNSRVPVLIGNSGARGILLGDNSRQPRVVHLSDGARLEPDQDVVTSGVGGLFPRGLRIGVIKGTDEGWRVELHAHLDRLDHVSVLFYETPELEIAAEVPRASTGELARRRAAARRAGNVVPQPAP